MKQYFLAGIIFSFPFALAADPVAVSPAMSTLQAQIRQLNAQLANANQTMNAVEAQLASTQRQLEAVSAQVRQYSDPLSQQFRWVDVSSNQLPANALVAAYNGNTPIYVCQATYSDGGEGYASGGTAVLDPGIVSDKGCVITYGGNAYLVPNYAVLTSETSGYWINGDAVKSVITHTPYYPPVFARNASAGVLSSSSPPNEPTPLYNALAIIGGQENGNNVYVCRVNINGQYFVGKSIYNTCFIATGRYEANWPVYEVLLSRKP
jgi:hypothetical protein